MGYVKFENERSSESRKTKIWDVLSLDNKRLGEIRFFGAWRKYVFYPDPSCYDASCLREIAEFLERKAVEWRKGTNGLR